MSVVSTNNDILFILSVAVTLNHPLLAPSITGAGLPYDYILNHLHFHWESEHTIHSNR